MSLNEEGIYEYTCMVFFDTLILKELTLNIRHGNVSSKNEVFLGVSGIKGL